jgi:hypothetical protein
MMFQRHKILFKFQANSSKMTDGNSNGKKNKKISLNGKKDCETLKQ